MGNHSPIKTTMSYNPTGGSFKSAVEGGVVHFKSTPDKGALVVRWFISSHGLVPPNFGDLK